MSGDYKYKSMENRRRAKFLLDKLMPEARKLMEKITGAEAFQNPLGEHTMPHLHINRVTGVHLYQGKLGGWYFDLTFKDLPPGIPEIMGQPVEHPCKTREEAIKGAVAMLAYLLARKDKPLPGADEAVVVFPFDEVAVKLPSSIIAELEKFPLPKNRQEMARHRLDEVRKEFAKDGPLTMAIMDGLTNEQRAAIMSVAAMAVVSGIARWPESVEMAPEEGMSPFGSGPVH
jgi:hypothetical protein